METDGGFPSLASAQGECRRWIEVCVTMGGLCSACDMWRVSRRSPADSSLIETSVSHCRMVSCFASEISYSGIVFAMTSRVFLWGTMQIGIPDKAWHYPPYQRIVDDVRVPSKTELSVLNVGVTYDHFLVRITFDPSSKPANSLA